VPSTTVYNMNVISMLIAVDRSSDMAEEPINTELDECSVEVSCVNEEEALGYTHDDSSGGGEVSYYTVAASESDCLELMVDGVELSNVATTTGSVECEEDVNKDGITILTADGRLITDGIGQLIQCDFDSTEAAAAAANAQHLVLNLAHPMGTCNYSFVQCIKRQHVQLYGL